jgi:hypothetical protein
MTMRKTLILVVMGLTLVSSPAFAKVARRHCIDKDMNEIRLTARGKARPAACAAAGGTWVKAKRAKSK